jgi:hypothetical protein
VDSMRNIESFFIGKSLVADFFYYTLSEQLNYLLEDKEIYELLTSDMDLRERVKLLERSLVEYEKESLQDCKFE